MKKLILGAALATLLAAPALAQSYSGAAGTGNTINLPLAERTNGAAGVGISAYDGSGMSTAAYAYSPAHARKRVRSRRRHY